MYNQGFLKAFKGRPDHGYEKISDRSVRTFQYLKIKEGIELKGDLYLPTKAAKVLNNHLSPGLRGRWWFDAYRS